MFYSEDENDELPEENVEQESEQNEYQEEETTQQNTSIAQNKTKEFLDQQMRKQKILQKMSNTKGMSVISSVLKIIGPY